MAGAHLAHLSAPFVQLALSSWGGGDRKAGWKEGQIAFPLGQRGPPGGFTGEDR